MTREVTVVDKDGRSANATLLVCEECAGETFYIYEVEPGKHKHLQCGQCGTVFCDGAWAFPAPRCKPQWPHRPEEFVFHRLQDLDDPELDQYDGSA